MEEGVVKMLQLTRQISDEERHQLRQMTLDSTKSTRARVILLAEENFTVTDIADYLEINEKTVRKWFHLFEEEGVAGLRTVVRRSEAEAVRVMVPRTVKDYLWTILDAGLDAWDLTDELRAGIESVRDQLG